tara:strand:+ start:342 stop:566 length:225 start_codon:yes stop_codon:yes gene_type:complete
MASIYHEFEALGVEMSNHESDLYVRPTPEVKAIIERRRAEGETLNVSHFIADDGTGSWMELPFRYAPFWDKKPR